jgi:hypothetical protein
MRTRASTARRIRTLSTWAWVCSRWVLRETYSLHFLLDHQHCHALRFMIPTLAHRAHPQACLAFNQPASLPGHLAKLEAALERAYPSTSTDKAPASASAPGPGPGPGSAGPSGAGRDAASMTAADLRDARERETRTSAIRAAVAVKVKVARGLVALGNGEYERAGWELGGAMKDGLGVWEGQVSARGWGLGLDAMAGGRRGGRGCDETGRCCTTGRETRSAQPAALVRVA